MAFGVLFSPREQELDEMVSRDYAEAFKLEGRRRGIRTLWKNTFSLMLDSQIDQYHTVYMTTSS